MWNRKKGLMDGWMDGEVKERDEKKRQGEGGFKLGRDAPLEMGLPLGLATLSKACSSARHFKPVKHTLQLFTLPSSCIEEKSKAAY